MSLLANNIVLLVFLSILGITLTRNDSDSIFKHISDDDIDYYDKVKMCVLILKYNIKFENDGKTCDLMDIYNNHGMSNFNNMKTYSILILNNVAEINDFKLNDDLNSILQKELEDIGHSIRLRNTNDLRKLFHKYPGMYFMYIEDIVDKAYKSNPENIESIQEFVSETYKQPFVHIMKGYSALIDVVTRNGQLACNRNQILLGLHNLYDQLQHRDDFDQDKFNILLNKLSNLEITFQTLS